MVAGGLALVAVGMVLFTLADVDSSWTIVLPGAMVALIGTGLFNPALTAVALGTVPPEQSGVAAGVNDTFRQAGIAVGVAALGALVPAEAAFGGSPQEYVNGLHDALLRRRRAGRDRRRRRLVPHLPPVRRRGSGAERARGAGRGRARARPRLSRSETATPATASPGGGRRVGLTPALVERRRGRTACIEGEHELPRRASARARDGAG